MINQEIRGNLARLLATENLVVEHRKVATASFDVLSRVLTLPMWDKASNVVYDLLVGHEVGHALFTPLDLWDADIPKDFINVVEDARIEKLMKRKYAGLNKDFYNGYQELNEDDFFDIVDQDLSQFNLIDRINLHFKIGAYARIPFVEEEQIFVDKVSRVETFKEVIDLCRELKEYLNEPNNDAESISIPQSSQDGEESDSDETQSENENSEKPCDTDDDCGNDGTDETVSESLIQGKQGGDKYESQTQKSFDEAAEELTNQRSYGTEPVYVEVPEVNLDQVIVNYDKLQNYLGKYWEDLNENRRQHWGNIFEQVDSSFAEFKKSSQKEVNYLVKEFECRKSADAYARASQSKTGVLDTSKLHTYKYNEDLFKKVTVLPDGKNHGMIFILDWSGSMVNEILDTVMQLINLTSFCKKVDIPFEVYAFTNDYYPVRRILNNSDGNRERYSECVKNEICLSKGMFHMMNMLSSRSNSKDYERMCLNLYREAYAYTRGVAYQTTIGIGLSGTPLNEAVIMLNYIIPEFKLNNDLQKVNVCILTDGESCQAAYGREYYNEHLDEYYIRPRRIDGNIVLRDRKTGNVYKTMDGWAANTNIFINQVRDRFPMVNVLGFRIMSGSALSSFVTCYGDQNYYGEVTKQWKREKCAIIPAPKAFTALYAISNTSLSQSTEFDVDSGATKKDISKAFRKMLKGKSTNKKLLNSFVEYIA